MRPLALALLFPLVAVAQPPDFPAPKTFPPDEVTLKTIKDKTAELKKATEKIADPDVLVYLKAAEWIVKHGEWFTDKSAQQTLAVLDAGLERAKNADKKPWLAVRDKPIILGYKSLVDDSIQPYAVRLPEKIDPKTQYRVDVILHGRDATLSEVKFLHARETAKKGKPLDHIEIEVYGRGNNAYRWAGEQDVFEARANLVENHSSQQPARKLGLSVVNVEWGVLRGFSMGGAGTWHIGLRHPFAFQAIGPGAGFSTTREYIGEAKFGTQPDYIEKCLHIYDAVDYAENCFNVPVVAYSGEKDKQKLAADLIEAKLKDFKEPHSFTHVIAPGLEHSQPADWQKKLEEKYQEILKAPRAPRPERIRYVTYAPRSPLSWLIFDLDNWVYPTALEKQYEKAVVDATQKDGELTVNTRNVRMLIVLMSITRTAKSLTVDGESIRFKQGDEVHLLRTEGKWKVVPIRLDEQEERPIKDHYQCGPIDDAFCSRFTVVTPTDKPWHEESASFAETRREEFAKNWIRYFRGEPRTMTAKEFLGKQLTSTQILFGDPQNNPAIAKVLPKLPITWTKEKLVVNGKEYDPKTHLPVLIYPNPDSWHSYVVINSGHTFREADLKGTNAMLYPRLGDWAVLKAKPTKDDPAGFEVIDAGLFDENWQFPKAK